MNTLQDKIGALSEEARGWLLGTKSENPLGCAFTKKRVVHPGAGGKRMIMDKAEQARIWEEHMAAAPDPADERAVYIHIPFCDKKCSYCGFFQNFTREDAVHGGAGCRGRYALCYGRALPGGILWRRHPDGAQ